MNSLRKHFKYEYQTIDTRSGSVVVYTLSAGQYAIGKERASCYKERLQTAIFEGDRRSKQVPNPNLQKFIAYLKVKDGDTVDDLYKIVYLFEVCGDDLDKDLKDRIMTGGSYSEQDILQMIRSIVNAGAFLQSQNIVHGDIKPANILIPTPGRYKLSDPLMSYNFNSQYQQICYNYGPWANDCYLAPELFNNVLAKTRNPEHNPFKSDVFSLGLCALVMATRKSIQLAYHFNQPAVDQMVLANAIDTAAQMYSDQLVKLLKTMLEMDDYHRPDFLSLHELVFSEPFHPPQEGAYISHDYRQEMVPHGDFVPSGQYSDSNIVSLPQAQQFEQVVYQEISEPTTTIPSYTTQTVITHQIPEQVVQYTPLRVAEEPRRVETQIIQAPQYVQSSPRIVASPTVTMVAQSIAVPPVTIPAPVTNHIQPATSPAAPIPHLSHVASDTRYEMREAPVTNIGNIGTRVLPANAHTATASFGPPRVIDGPYTDTPQSLRASLGRELASLYMTPQKRSDSPVKTASTVTQVNGPDARFYDARLQRPLDAGGWTKAKLNPAGRYGFGSGDYHQYMPVYDGQKYPNTSTTVIRGQNLNLGDIEARINNANDRLNSLRHQYQS